MTPGELSEKIRNGKRNTPVRVFLETADGVRPEGCKVIGEHGVYVLFGDYGEVTDAIYAIAESVKEMEMEVLARESVLGGADILAFDARIEPGAYVREGAEICRGAVIMHGAVINSGAVIGGSAMIDMNAVIGSCAVIGAGTHVGAGAVIAGALEPFSDVPVRIGAGVLIGANAVVLEGLSVGDGAVIGAGAVVTRDVPENAVAVGIPARIVGDRSSVRGNAAINGDLR